MISPHLTCRPDEGAVAQLVERSLCMREVGGSKPSSSIFCQRTLLSGTAVHNVIFLTASSTRLRMAALILKSGWVAI
eukprot:jgi/Chrzof1/3164/Cz12g14070.t1